MASKMMLASVQSCPIYSFHESLSKLFCSENLSSVPSAVLEKEWVPPDHPIYALLTEIRKDKATGGVFALRFTWSEALDTAAAVYHGVG